MSIEWDNSITEISDIDKTNYEYCEINITNTFKKFATAIGGDKLWFDIVDSIARNHGYKKPNYYEVANEPMPKDYCECEDEVFKTFKTALNAKTKLESEQTDIETDKTPLNDKTELDSVQTDKTVKCEDSSFNNNAEGWRISPEASSFNNNEEGWRIRPDALKG